ncbi:MAG: 2Fe-2S iron-sulfur cluster-binding protein [Ferrovibrionaceae bacterium]
MLLDCIAVRDETPTVKSFALRPRETGFCHLPGQAVTLALDIAGETLYRTFSIASAPGGETIELTIKRHPQGRATGWLHQVLGPGMTVSASGPVGRFVLDGAGPVAFVSAGSGASPLMAMLRHLAATAPGTDVAWFHAARDEEEVVFARELTALQRQLPKLSVSVVLSRPGPGWFGYRGRLGRRLLSVAIPDFARRRVYCCGPDGFMQAARLIHAAEGGAKDDFHIEHFGAAPKAPDVLVGETDASTVEVTLGERSFPVAPTETILEAATRRQIVIPCGCASGICGTCRVKIVTGEVTMRHNGGLSPEDEAAGYILACSSRPRTDVTITL